MPTNLAPTWSKWWIFMNVYEFGDADSTMMTKMDPHPIDDVEMIWDADCHYSGHLRCLSRLFWPFKWRFIRCVYIYIYIYLYTYLFLLVFIYIYILVSIYIYTTFNIYIYIYIYRYIFFWGGVRPGRFFAVWPGVAEMVPCHSPSPLSRDNVSQRVSWRISGPSAVHHKDFT